MSLPKMTGTRWVLISLTGVVIILLIVLFRSCKPVPKDQSQVTIDSIKKEQRVREDSLKIIIDSVSKKYDSVLSVANSAEDYAAMTQDDANRFHIKYLGIKEQYEKLKAVHDTSALEACDQTVEAAGKTIVKLDSTILLKNKSIAAYKKAIDYQEARANSLQTSRDGFKRDFMKLQTDIIPPLQAQLKESNKQWKANRFWKKTFAGLLAGAIIYGTVQTFNH